MTSSPFHFDWTPIEKANIDTIVANDDVVSLKKLVDYLNDFDVTSDINLKLNVLKALKIFQLYIKILEYSVKENDERIVTLEKTCQELKQQNSKLFIKIHKINKNQTNNENEQRSIHSMTNKSLHGRCLYQCICGKVFKNNRFLNAHVRRRHASWRIHHITSSSNLATRVNSFDIDNEAHECIIPMEEISSQEIPKSQFPAILTNEQHLSKKSSSMEIEMNNLKNALVTTPVEVLYQNENYPENEPQEEHSFVLPITQSYLVINPELKESDEMINETEEIHPSTEKKIEPIPSKKFEDERASEVESQLYIRSTPLLRSETHKNEYSLRDLFKKYPSDSQSIHLDEPVQYSADELTSSGLSFLSICDKDLSDRFSSRDVLKEQRQTRSSSDSCLSKKLSDFCELNPLSKSQDSSTSSQDNHQDSSKCTQLSNSSSTNIKYYIIEEFDKEMRIIGIDPSWKSIPKNTYNKIISVINHKKIIDSKGNKYYESMSKYVHESLQDLIHSSRNKNTKRSKSES